MAVASSSRIVPGDGPVSEEPEKTFEQQIVEAWEKLNLLTLDGGGIRGLWTLLVLKMLMYFIAEEEERLSPDNDNDCHSFYPQNFPANVSHLEMNTVENTRLESLDHTQSHQQFKAWDAEKRFLPCHYFDYIGGTSTGGLIAIMLGRLRMTVPDCIQEYKNFAGQIFGKPRHFTELKYNVGGRSKYDANKMKDIFKDITRRRGENSIQVDPLRFASKPKTCKCFVTSLRANTHEKGNKTSGTVQLIRSYDCITTKSEESSSHPTLRSTVRSKSTRSVPATKAEGHEKLRGYPLVTMGPADNFEIWEVARATTAAPFYFDHIAIETRGAATNRIRIYEDGGLGQTTNPTLEGIRDISRQHDADAVAIVVSVGTARGEFQRQKDLLFGESKAKIMSEIWSQSDPQKVHEDIEESEDLYPNMDYWRLNPSAADDGQLLNMPLDEWEPKNTWKNGQQSGTRTVSRIEAAFANWARQPEVQKQLKECAERLVTQRRLRTNDVAQWERFSMAVDYKCRHFKCPKLLSKFTNLAEFEQHMKSKHGIRDEKELEEQTRISWYPWKYPRPPSKT